MAATERSKRQAAAKAVGEREGYDVTHQPANEQTGEIETWLLVRTVDGKFLGTHASIASLDHAVDADRERARLEQEASE